MAMAAYACPHLRMTGWIVGMKHGSTMGVAGLALFALATTQAQTPTALDFSMHAEVQEVALSPDGRHVTLAVPTPDGMETMLQIVALDGSGQGQLLRFGKQQHVSDITWSDDTQLVVARAKMEPLRARPISQGDLFSTDLNGKNQRTLFAYVPGASGRAAIRKDQGFATLVKVLDDEPGKVLVDFHRLAGLGERREAHHVDLQGRHPRRYPPGNRADAGNRLFQLRCLGPGTPANHP
ncbi:MAG: hypothetical protein EOP93_01035 [Lysobacteraceae bacterium]|nr:MAG: hypothetical protein EOP93_01035 [Xanthomonadaceae bacterium]